jgi:hypothetical protein
VSSFLQTQTKPFPSGFNPGRNTEHRSEEGRRWEIKRITFVEAAVGSTRREILAIYIRITASGTKTMRRGME